MKTPFDFSGKTILITGASSGIGQHAAITLSEYGARTILLARREDKLQETLKMLSGDGHIYKVFDLNELEKIEDIVSEIVSETGKLDGMAFCAGIAPTVPCKATTPKILLETMQINFFSFHEITRQFIKKKFSNDGSKIVAISSVASIKPGKGQSAYCASKGAMESVIRSIAKEVMPRKICINSIRPSFVDTPLTEQYKATVEGASEVVSDIQQLGVINPVETSNMITYLLSPMANKITGNAFNIDSGSLL